MNLDIRVTDRLCVPSQPVAGIAGDHLTSTLVFQLGREPTGSLFLKLSLNGTPDKLALTVDANDASTYRCTLRRASLHSAGRMSCQLVEERASPSDAGDVLVWQSYVFPLLVGQSIDADTAIADEYPSLLQQLATALAGGTAGQLLYKVSDADYDVEWRDLEIPSQYGLVSYDQDKTITVS